MTPSERLRQAREAAGYTTAKAAAEAMGASVSTYIQHENGGRNFPAGKAARYARFFRVTPQWLLYGQGDAPDGLIDSTQLQPVSRHVPVLGEIQAGAWKPIPDDQPAVEEAVPVYLPGFDGANLFALRVRGPSMDRHYADGSLVIVCPAAEIGVREGDHVVVRRRRGNEYETTLKEVAKTKTGVNLWPRSNDRDHQEPISLRSDRDADEGVEIIAVVVSSYVIRPVQQKPLIRI